MRVYNLFFLVLGAFVMIRINSFLHRQQLYDITRRWLADQLEPADLVTLKTLINFNSLWINRLGRDFAQWFFPQFSGDKVQEQTVSNKGELKDLLVQNPRYVNERIISLNRRYEQHPERYLRETPFSGVLYSVERQGKPAYIGSRRIKRVRRIAEKGARRISDYIYKQIKQRADLLAQERADIMGIHKSELISTPEQMNDEFERAESRIAMALSRGQLFPKEQAFILEDVLGVKVIAEEYEQPKVIQLLKEHPHCEIIEIEHHRGHYNATNVVFRYAPNKEELLAQPLSTIALDRLVHRGLRRDRVEGDFRQFVLSGEDSIHIELIISDFQEMLESEIGRSMHENRIIRQRMNQSYRGHLARNVSYLMEFMFACGISPKTRIDDLPIKVWIRYMPDYFDEVLKDLFQIPRFREIE
tara:strand:+ start:1079 stop:2323 length:1245 start_codon:yes stop_codon:yes gene_type:complete